MRQEIIRIIILIDTEGNVNSRKSLGTLLAVDSNAVPHRVNRISFVVAIRFRISKTQSHDEFE